MSFAKAPWKQALAMSLDDEMGLAERASGGGSSWPVFAGSRFRSGFASLIFGHSRRIYPQLSKIVKFDLVNILELLYNLNAARAIPGLPPDQAHRQPEPFFNARALEKGAIQE
jgi:hypothetical protein